VKETLIVFTPPLLVSQLDDLQYADHPSLLLDIMASDHSETINICGHAP